MRVVIVYLFIFLVSCKSVNQVVAEVGNNTDVQVNYRLHDIWALNTIDSIDAGRDRSNAYLEFNLTTDKIYGNTGCNSLSGDLIVKADSLRMFNIAVSEMLCIRFQNEQEYISSLEQPMSYSIEGLELTLKSKQTTFTFRKVD